MTPRGGYIKDTPTLHRRCPKKGSGGDFGGAVLHLMRLDQVLRRDGSSAHGREADSLAGGLRALGLVVSLAGVRPAV